MGKSQVTSQGLKVLMVEDNPGDMLLTREALEDSKLKIELSCVDNGNKAMDFLFQRGEYANAQQPDLILLDLNLPGKDGREVLEELKQDRRLKRIPVVVLSSSEANVDILRSYDLGVNCYVTKPVGLEDFATIVKSIEQFWFTIVKLPPKVSYRASIRGDAEASP